ncbi:MAG: 8-oxo-dGTP diphosphatase MutT [Pseudomonadota bacterium]
MERKTDKPHFHVTAGLIWHDGKLLIARRPPGTHLEGLWEFPGGKQEKGETLQECLERELREELGMKVRAENLVCTVEHEYENRTISLHLFQCSYLSGQPMPLEGQETRWVHPKDLGEYNFPPPDYTFIRFLNKEPRPNLSKIHHQ